MFSQNEKPKPPFYGTALLPPSEWNKLLGGFACRMFVFGDSSHDLCPVMAFCLYGCRIASNNCKLQETAANGVEPQAATI